MNIEDAFDELRVSYITDGNTHCRPGWIQIDCPFCGAGSHKYHMGYHLGRRYFNCWKCGGHSLRSVFESLGVSGSYLRSLLQEIRPHYTFTETRQRHCLKEPAGRGRLLSAHRHYLRSRGFDPEALVRIWDLEGIGIALRLSWRIYIPITQNGVRVSWTTRAIGPRVMQRYISASAAEEAVNHKHVVYGLDKCRHAVVIVEGPVDAWAIGPGAGALFGTAFSAAQVKQLVKIPRRVVVFDSSRDAQNRAEQLAAQLSGFPGVTLRLEIDAKDPASAKKQEIRKILRIARL